eukprot:2747242-Rhodomonas_salina.1
MPGLAHEARLDQLRCCLNHHPCHSHRGWEPEQSVGEVALAQPFPRLFIQPCHLGRRDCDGGQQAIRDLQHVLFDAHDECSLDRDLSNGPA